MFKRYELHNHTDESDAPISCGELIRRMVAERVDCFAITDHNTVSGHGIIRNQLERDGEYSARSFNVASDRIFFSMSEHTTTDEGEIVRDRYLSFRIKG